MNARPSILFRTILLAMTLVVLHFSQKFKGRQTDVPDIEDVFHTFSGDLNQLLHDINPKDTSFFATHNSRVLITAIAQLIVDFSVIYLAITGIVFEEGYQTMASVIVLVLLRQLCQFSVNLPIPHGIFWSDPGIPSIVVDYDVVNDFFFSGHTSLTVLTTLVMIRWHHSKAALVMTIASIYQMFYLLVFRVHYTVDVIAGLFAPFFVEYLTAFLAPAKPYRPQENSKKIA